MLKRNRRQHGFTLIEVLIAIVLTAFGLLGVAALMSRMQVAQTEGYYRAQAMSLLWNMRDRLQSGIRTDTQANATADANAYTGGGTILTVGTAGTGVTTYTPPCTGSGSTRELCEWQEALLGAAETRGSAKVGAMTDARGCIELINAPDLTPGTCTPATFRVSVAWQGMTKTAAPPANVCGQNLYSDETFRRVVAQQVTIGTPSCTNN